MTRLLGRATAGCIVLILLSDPSSAQTTLAQGIRELADQIAGGVSKEQKRKIAVLPFRQIGGDQTVFGEYLSEELITHLYQAGGLEVVERGLLDQLLAEIQLGQTGVIDPKTAKQVGKVAGVDAIVTGTITELQSYVSVNCRLIDTETGRLFGAAQAKIVKDPDVIGMLPSAAPHGSASGATVPDTQPTVRAGLPKPVEWDGFRFTLRSCQYIGGSVRCELLVDNVTDASIGLNVYTGRASGFRTGPELGSTALYDSSGNQYYDAEAELGAAPRGGREVVYPGIPLIAKLTFRGIPSDLTTVSLAVLVEAGRRTHVILFRDARIAR